MSLVLLPYQENAPLPAPVNQAKISIKLADIGYLFFNDKSLSQTGKISCASCHKPDLHYQDGLERALVGSNFLSRNTPSLLNVNRYRSFFWDGRAKSIEDQLNGPLFSRVELNTNINLVRSSINKNPNTAGFFKIWKVLNPSRNEIDFLKQALEAFIATITTKQTRFDLYNRNKIGFSGLEKDGMAIFFGKAGCVRCHKPPNFTDNLFHDIGLYRRRIIYQTIHVGGHVEESVTVDRGIGDIIGGTENMFKFRTASLVNVNETAPYMHDGSLPTLEAVVDFYDRGGDVKASLRKPLGLTVTEKKALIAFLKTLSDSHR